MRHCPVCGTQTEALTCAVHGVDTLSGDVPTAVPFGTDWNTATVLPVTDEAPSSSSSDELGEFHVGHLATAVSGRKEAGISRVSQERAALGADAQALHPTTEAHQAANRSNAHERGIATETYLPTDDALHAEIASSFAHTRGPIAPVDDNRTGPVAAATVQSRVQALPWSAATTPSVGSGTGELDTSGVSQGQTGTGLDILMDAALNDSESQMVRAASALPPSRAAAAGLFTEEKPALAGPFVVTSEDRPHAIPVESVVPVTAEELAADGSSSMGDMFVAVARTVLVGGAIIAACYWGYSYLAQPVSTGDHVTAPEDN